MNCRKLFFLALVGTSMCVPLSAKAAYLEVWTEETESDRVKTIQVLLDTFQALNPDVTVKLVAVEENETAAQMAAAAAAGTLPNIIITSSDLLAAFGKEGLMDTSIASEEVREIGEDRFYGGALRAMQSTQRHNYYGVPFHGWLQGLWYRADWFAEAGLEPPNTWENIKKAAEYFYKPDKNQYGILIGTDNAVYSEEVFTPFALSNNVREFDESGQVSFNSPEAVETLKFYSELAKYGPAGPQSWRARDYYLQGKLAMFFYSTFIMDDLALADAAASSLTSKNFKDLQGAAFDPGLVEKTDVITTISHKAKGSFGSIQGVGILKSPDHDKQEASRKLLEFLFQKDAYLTWMHMSSGGFIPVLRDIATSPDYLDDPKALFERYGKQKIEALLTGFETMGSFRFSGEQNFPQAGEIFAKAVIPRMVYGTIFEGVPAEKAVASADGEMKTLVGGK